eukprot:6213400-Pleurochrysis_carterae.AAC.4
MLAAFKVKQPARAEEHVVTAQSLAMRALVTLSKDKSNEWVDEGVRLTYAALMRPSNGLLGVRTSPT